MKLFVLAFLLLASLAAPARADDLAVVMAQLAQVPHASAHFTEYRTSQLLTQPLESSGTLSWIAPAHLEKATLQPQLEHMTVDGDNLTIRHQGETRVLALTDYPPLAALVESLRATLAGDLPTLQRLYVVTFSGSAAQWQLQLEPRDPKIGDLVTRITLSGNGHSVSKIETLESNGDQSLMQITPDAP